MVSYLQGQKQRVRVTLEFDVYSDFNARDINYEKLFNLDGDEKVEVYVEDVNDIWWKSTDIVPLRELSTILPMGGRIVYCI